MLVEMAFGLCLCLCVTCLWPSSHVSFSATFQQAILLASCNAILHWFSTRHGASELVRNFIFIYIMCTLVGNAGISMFHLSYRLQGLHFLILFSLRPYLASGLALFSLLVVWGWGEHFASFHFISSLCVLWRGKCRFSFQPHLREGYLLFREMGQFPQKPKLP